VPNGLGRHLEVAEEKAAAAHRKAEEAERAVEQLD
jgi:hypothetical protein